MTEEMDAAVSAATAFRSAGIRCQIYAEKRKFKAKMSYADRIGVPFVVLLGEDELAKGLLSLKNMETGEQLLISAEEAAEIVAETVRIRNGAAPIRA